MCVYDFSIKTKKKKSRIFCYSVQILWRKLAEYLQAQSENNHDVAPDRGHPVKGQTNGYDLH